MADDTEIRTRVYDTEKNLAKLWTFVYELASVVWGDNTRRDNGIRSRVIALEARAKEAEDDRDSLRRELRHYLDVSREETCHGLKALAEREQSAENAVKEEIPVKIETIKANSAQKTQIIILVGVIVSALLNTLGLLMRVS
jgi:hypothetical protein